MRTCARTLVRWTLPILLAAPFWLVPTAAHAGSVAFTIRAPHHGEIEYTKAARISGKATSGGSPVASTKIELLQNPFPYKGFHKVATTTTSSTGAYHFSRKPSHDTRYRVALVSDPTDHSPTLIIYVEGLFFDPQSSWTSTTITVSFKVRDPAGVDREGVPVSFYLGLDHASRLKLTGTDHFGAPITPGVTKTTHTYHVKAGWSYFQWYILGRDLPKQGEGRAVCLGPEGWNLGKPTCRPPKSISAKTHM